MKSKLTAYVFYEHVSRELQTVDKLVSDGRRAGLDIYAFSYLYEYFEALNFSKQKRPDVIIVPYIYSQKSFSRYRHFIACNPDIIIVNFHHEQIVAPFNLPKAIPSYLPALNDVYHVSWGRKYSKKLKNSGVDDYKIIQLRSPRITLTHNSPVKTKQALAKLYHLNPSKKWILFCEDRDWTVNDQIKVHTNLKTFGVSLAEISKFTTQRELSLEKFAQDSFDLPQVFFDKFEIIYRPHPGVTGAIKLNPRIKIISEQSVTDWLKVVDINVVDNSTTAFESDVLGVKTAVLNSIPLPQRWQVFGINRYESIDSFNQLNEKAVLDRLTHSLKNKNFASYVGDPNIDFNNEFIKIIPSLKSIRFTHQPLKLRKYFFKKYCFEIAAKILPQLIFDILASRYIGEWIIRDKPQRHKNATA